MTVDHMIKKAQSDYSMVRMRIKSCIRWESACLIMGTLGASSLTCVSFKTRQNMKDSIKPMIRALSYFI